MTDSVGELKFYPFFRKDVTAMGTNDRLKLSLKDDDSSLIFVFDRDGMGLWGCASVFIVLPA